MLDKPQAIILTESNPDYTCISSDDWEDIVDHFDGLVQGRRNSIANAQELRLSCTKALRWRTKMMLYELTGKRWSRYTISYTSMAWSKIYVTPVCWRYSYIAFALSHCYIPVKIYIMLCCHPIGKTPVRIILWCPTTKMLIKACFLIEPLEQEGGYQKCCICLCSKVFINHFYQMKASPECLDIIIY